jgi:hypothetical protein
MLIDSHTLENRGLATLALSIGGLMLLRNSEASSIVGSNLEEG